MENKIDQFLNALASSSPVPGGGGASALVGAVGTALGSMVCGLTTGKKKYAAFQEDIERITQQANQLRLELTQLADRDEQVFLPLSKAYGLPKSTPEEQAEKDRVLEAALKNACSVPMEIMEKVNEAIDLHSELVDKGSRLALSDVGVGIVFCQAALRGARLNVLINTKYMKDRDYAQDCNKKAEELQAQGYQKSEEVYKKVEGALI